MRNILKSPRSILPSELPNAIQTILLIQYPPIISITQKMAKRMIVLFFFKKKKESKDKKDLIVYIKLAPNVSKLLIQAQVAS
jgi:hypothetical protein